MSFGFIYSEAYIHDFTSQRKNAQDRFFASEASIADAQKLIEESKDVYPNIGRGVGDGHAAQHAPVCMAQLVWNCLDAWKLGQKPFGFVQILLNKVWQETTRIHKSKHCSTARKTEGH